MIVSVQGVAEEQNQAGQKNFLHSISYSVHYTMLHNLLIPEYSNGLLIGWGRHFRKVIIKFYYQSAPSCSRNHFFIPRLEGMLWSVMQSKWIVRSIQLSQSLKSGGLYFGCLSSVINAEHNFRIEPFLLLLPTSNYLNLFKYVLNYTSKTNFLEFLWNSFVLWV